MSDINIYEDMTPAEAYEYDTKNNGKRFTKKLIAEYIVMAEQVHNIYAEHSGKRLNKVPKVSTLLKYSKEDLADILDNIMYFGSHCGFTYGTFLFCYDAIQAYGLECVLCVKFGGDCRGMCKPISGICPHFKDIAVRYDDEGDPIY